MTEKLNIKVFPLYQDPMKLVERRLTMTRPVDRHGAREEGDLGRRSESQSENLNQTVLIELGLFIGGRS